MSSSWSVSPGRDSEGRREWKRFRLIWSTDLNGKRNRFTLCMVTIIPEGPIDQKSVRKVKATRQFLWVKELWVWGESFAVEAKCTRLGTEMADPHSRGLSTLPAAPGSPYKGWHPLWLYSFSGCWCRFVEHGSLLGSLRLPWGEGGSRIFPLLLISFLPSSRSICQHLSTGFWLKASW